MAQTPINDVRNLEQLAFDAGVKFAMEWVEALLPHFITVASLRPDPEATELGMEQWRKLGMVRDLEKKVRG